MSLEQRHKCLTPCNNNFKLLYRAKGWGTEGSSLDEASHDLGVAVGLPLWLRGGQVRPARASAWTSSIFPRLLCTRSWQRLAFPPVSAGVGKNP